MTFDQWWQALGIQVVRPTDEIARASWNAALEEACKETTHSRTQHAIRALKAKQP